MVNKKVLLGVLSVVVAVQATLPPPVLTLLSTTGDRRVKCTAPYGDYVYTGYFINRRVGIYDVTNPAAPVLLGRFGGSQRPHKVEVVGSILYIRRRWRVETWDLVDPVNPAFVASVPTPNSFSLGSPPFAFSGNYLYINTYNKVTVLLTDASGSLTFVTNVFAPNWSIDKFLVVVGTKLYLLRVAFRIAVFDITDPALPVLQTNWIFPFTRFYDAFHLNGYLYFAGIFPNLGKIDLNTGNLVPLTSPAEVTPFFGISHAILYEAPYIYLGAFHNGALYILEEDPTNVISIVEKHTTRRPTDIDIDSGRLYATSLFHNRMWIYENNAQCLGVTGPLVEIDGEALEGVALAGATTYTNGPKQLSRIPANFGSMKVHMPETDVFEGSVIDLSCCGDGPVCEFVLTHYHCPPCSAHVNGHFPKDLPDKGFEAGSCAPKYGATEERMTSYRVQVQPGETLMLDPLGEDATSFAIFSQEGALPDPWCPAKEGRPGCGGPCPPNVCTCFDTHNELVDDAQMER